jgi:hypothetical protein
MDAEEAQTAADLKRLYTLQVHCIIQRGELCVLEKTTRSEEMRKFKESY